jgi:NAD-dependent SIR2 family protein deacetylase
LLITQNVDRLHQKAGSKNVIDLHGRNDRLSCLQCGCQISRNIIQKQIELLNPEILDKIKLLINSNNVNTSLRADGDANLDGIIDYNNLKIPKCHKCNGTLKPNVVFFGDNVNPNTVQDIYKTIENSDSLLVIGTSLEVYSAFRFVDRFAKKSNNIAIINKGQTRADYSNIPIKIRSESNCSILLKKTADLIDNFYSNNKILNE